MGAKKYPNARASERWREIIIRRLRKEQQCRPTMILYRNEDIAMVCLGRLAEHCCQNQLTDLPDQVVERVAKTIRTEYERSQEEHIRRYSKEMRRWLASMMRRRGLRDVEGQDLDDLVQLCWHKYFAALVGPCQRQGIETSTRYRYQIVRNVFFDQVRRGQVRQAVRRSQWVRLRDVAPDVIVYYQSTDEKGVVGKAIRDHRSVDPMEAAERREQIGVLRTWINRLESMGRHVLAAVLAALVESWGDKEAASRKLSMSMSTLNRNLSRMRNLLEEAGGLSAAQIRNWPIPVAKEGAVSSGNRFGAFQISADDDGAGGLHKREFDILDYNVPSEAVDQYGDSYCLGLA